MDLEKPRKKESPLLRAKDAIDLKTYEGVPSDSVPLVASVDYLVQKSKIEDPRIIEIGPVPTHYYLPGYHTDLSYQPDYYDEKTAERSTPRDIPPLWHIAQRHPEWKLAAVSPHDVSGKTKSKLFLRREDMFITKTGPEREGLHPEDVWNEEYRGAAEVMEKSYPILLEKLGGKPPNVILGRHVFDGMAKGYPVEKLTTVAAMILEKGGFLVSHVYGSDAENSHVPLYSNYFPFDSQKNMHLFLTLGFDRAKDMKNYVFVYQKTDDAVRINQLDN